MKRVLGAAVVLSLASCAVRPQAVHEDEGPPPKVVNGVIPSSRPPRTNYAVPLEDHDVDVRQGHVSVKMKKPAPPPPFGGEHGNLTGKESQPLPVAAPVEEIAE